MSESNSYNWDAKDYAKNSANQLQWAKELIPKLKLCGNESLFDIGCGEGKITGKLASRLPQGRVVGIDSSKQLINLAKSTFPKKEYQNLSFQFMDAIELVFQCEFDRVFSNADLHWIIDQKTVLRGVQKSLRAKGRLLFQMAGKGNAKDILSIVDEIISEEPWKEFFTNMTFPYGFYDTQEYEAFLREANLMPDRVEPFPKDMKFYDAEGLAGWVRTTWLPFTEKLPIQLRVKFSEEIVNRYLIKHPANGAGIVHVGMMRLEVEAYKP
jgi:trans-aconitate 2-methyltransferase